MGIQQQKVILEKKIFDHQSWEEDQQDVTDSGVESHSPSPDTTEVSPMPESEYMMPEERRQEQKISLVASIWFPSRRNKSLLKPLKPPVLLATNPLSRRWVRTVST